MPRYTVEDDFGNTLTLEGDAPPTEDELEEIFAQRFPNQSTSGTRGPAVPLSPWDDPQVLQQMQRSEQMRRDVGQGMEAGTEFTTALAEGIGIQPEVREESPEEQVTPGLPPEQAALELERLRLAQEGVPAIWRMGAAAHSGLSKGLQMPSNLIQSAARMARMLPGGKVAESLYAGINRDVFQGQLPDLAGANDEYFKAVEQWERRMSERDAMLGDPSFLTQLTEGTARGFAELPTQMMGGMAGSTPAAAMRGAAIGAGATSGLQTFGQQVGEGASDMQALARGGTAALVTGLTTRAFGATGVESIFRNQGPRGVANRIRDVLRQAGYEGAEEATDQFQQDLAQRFESDPNKSIVDTVNEVLMAGSVGALLGGGISAVHALGGDRDASQDQEAAAVYGDVPPQQQGQPTVPTQEGGAGVQQEGPLRMPMQIEQPTDEEVARMEREGMDESDTLLRDAITQEKAGGMVELGDLSTQAEGEVPFHGRLAIWDKNRGKIVVDPVAWHAEMQALPKEKRAAAARTIMNEEMTHVATDENDALNFFNLASGLEKALGRRIYTGKWGDKTFSDQDIGYEMIRRRIQRINKMTPTELFNTSRRERISVRSWQLLEDVVRKSREVLVDRGGSKQQIEILDRTLAKVQQVHQMAVEAEAGGEGEGPAAIARNQKVKEVVSRIEAGGAFPNNKAAVDAGLDAESIEDLDAMLEAKRDIQIKLQEARQRKDFNAMSTLVGPNQFLREAIEAATNAGSQRVDKRVTDYEKSLPMPKLDWRKNEQVRDWLEQNGPELGIEISEDRGPAAVRRAIPREKAAAIAKDLIEGGINTHHSVRLTAEGQGVSEDDVRRIKKILLKGGKDQVLSYADAIENGWEDEALGLRKSEGPAAMSRAAEKRIAALREKRLREIEASSRPRMTPEQMTEKIISLSNKQRESSLTEEEQEELRDLRRKRFEMEKDLFGPAALSRRGSYGGARFGMAHRDYTESLAKIKAAPDAASAREILESEVAKFSNKQQMAATALRSTGARKTDGENFPGNWDFSKVSSGVSRRDAKTDLADSLFKSLQDYSRAKRQLYRDYTSEWEGQEGPAAIRRSRGDDDFTPDFGEFNDLYDQISRKIAGARDERHAFQIMAEEEEKLDKKIKEEEVKFKYVEPDTERGAAHLKRMQDMIGVIRSIGDLYWASWGDEKSGQQSFPAAIRRGGERRSWYDSDVLSKDGTPITVFHGSPEELIRQGELRSPIFVTQDKGLAKRYQGVREEKGGLYSRLSRYGRVYPAHIKFNNPIEWTEGRGIPVEEAQRIFETTDHDAIVNPKNKEYALRDQSQIMMIDDDGRPIEGPAAIRRGGGTKRSQELSLLRRKLMEAKGAELPPELKTTGKPASGSAAEAVAPEERVSASESGAMERLTTEDLSAIAEEILSGDIKVRFRPKSEETLARDVERSNLREEEGTGRTGPFGVSAGRTTAERPSFKEFNDWAKRNFEGAQPHQLRSIWEDAVWGMLLKADPERLDEWRKALGLEKKYGRSVIYQPTSSQKTQEFNLLLEEGDKVLARQQKLSNEAAQRYRGKVIQAIAHKLVGESMDDRPALDRKEIELEDIDFGNAVAKFSPYEELGSEEISNPDIMKAVLRDQARGSNTDPESASRRLVAVVDRSTGKVELLSTYNDAGIQRITDPAGARLPRKPTRELNSSFLRQYRPFASLLLKDPVRGFRKQFGTVSEFNEKIGTEASQRSNIGENLQPGEADFKAEGTPGIEGEGGYLIGKHKAASGAEMSRPGVMESDVKLTKAEARGVVNQIWEEVGAFDSAEDVRDAIEGLNDKVMRGKLTSAERVAVSGLRKIYKAVEARGIGKGYEAATPDEKHAVFLDRVANSIFDVNEFAKTPQEFVDRITRLFEGEGSEAVSAEPESEFSRELSTMRDVPPTRVRPEQLPPGVEPVVGREQEPPVPRLRYQPEEEAEPEAPRPRTEGEMVAERAEAQRHRGRQVEMSQLWDELMNEPARTNDSRRQQAKAVRDTIYRRTGILISWDKAHEFVTNKVGTPREKVAAISNKIEESFASEVRPPDPPTRPPGTIWRSGPRVAPHLRVKGPAALRRTVNPTLSDIASNALHDIGSGYDAWMVDRIDDYGGVEAKKFAAEVRKIIDREKQLYGGLTPLLDRARKLAGGIEPSNSGLLDIRGRARELPGRVKSSFDAMRAVKWLNGLMEITPHTAVAKTVRAMEGTIGIPKFAENLIGAAQIANREIGAVVEPVTVRPKKKKRYTASGKFQRNLTSFGYDIIRQGGGDLWERWTQGIAEANKHVKGVTLDSVQKHFRRLKKTLDDPMTSDEILERINQDIARRYPRAVTHVKHLKRWHPVVHSDLFNYLENAARRATHIRAFRERYPKTDEGKKEFKDTIDDVKKELTGPVQKDLTGIIRALHGHPTDDYNSLEGTGLSPQEFFGQALRMMNQTVNNVLGKMVLSGQMFVQPGEVLAGSTPVFLGYDNYLKAAARYGQIYKLLEFNGARNPVMHDYTFNPMSPVRSLFKIGGNVISKVSMQNALNELQEGLAAATARVVAENIQSGNMNSWEKAMLPQTFRMMGFSPEEVTKMLAGDDQLLQQFQRKAAAFLTGGNKAIAESSRMGANRMFNSIFRFQTYPMIKTAQARGVLTNWVDAMRSGSKEQKKSANRLAGRFFFGNALQGALTVGLTSLAFGGMSGLKIRMEEAEDEPFKFLMEAFLSSISGPAYLLWRGKSQKGLGGYGEAAARLAFPYTIMNDMNDAAMGFGQYKDRPWQQRVGMFLKNKTPGTKAIRTGMAMAGLSSQNQQLDEAIKGLSRWRREELGFDENRSFPNEDRRKNFRMAMKRAIDAMKEGDQEAFNEAWFDAASDEEMTKIWMEKPNSADVVTKVSQSFKARKLLLDNEGSELTEEQKEALRSRIGDKAYEALEYYDLMIDEAAEGVLLPRAD